VAIQQQAEAEALQKPLDLAAQGLVVGDVAALDPLERGDDGEPLAVDRLAVGHHAGDGAQPRRHPRAAAVGVVGQGLVEELRIQLVGLAIGIDVGAREERADRYCAQARGLAHQFVDVAVLRTAQIVGIEHGGRQHVLGIELAGVRRGDDQRQLAAGRSVNGKGRTFPHPASRLSLVRRPQPWPAAPSFRLDSGDRIAHPPAKGRGFALPPLPPRQEPTFPLARPGPRCYMHRP